MTNTTYTLQLVPKGWKVVPSSHKPFSLPLANTMHDENQNEVVVLSRDQWDSIVEHHKPSPPIDTPSVLWWEDNCLYVGRTLIAYVRQVGEKRWAHFLCNEFDKIFIDSWSEQEARRAAEKALGFPDGLIIPET